MEARKFEQPRDTACSFETVLHPRYEAIKAESEPWILALTEPASSTAAQFWIDCSFPLLPCLAYPHCHAEHRVINIVKFLSWIFVADDEDDDPEILGADPITAPVMSRRQKLILACGQREECLPTTSHLHASNGNYGDHPRTIKSVKFLREVWRDMCKDMSDRLQARLYDGMRDYLNAVALQAHCRSTGLVPTMEEFVAIRRPASFTAICFIFLEYALGIELDDETLQNENIQQLIDGGVDHVAFTNDIMSCHVELFEGDQFNLPAVIYRNMRKSSNAVDHHERPGFTFDNAMRSARQTLEEVDERCVRLTEEVRKSEDLMKKDGIQEYVYGIGTWIAANREWSLNTARYTHKCPPEQGQVQAVEPQELTH